MIAILIAILLTISTGGDLCTLGNPVTNWEGWVDSHPNAESVVRYDATLPNFRIYQDGDSVVLFVFRNAVADTAASGSSGAHGQCARDLSEDVQP